LARQVILNVGTVALEELKIHIILEIRCYE